MLIAHSPVVHAVRYRPGTVPGDAAGVRDGGACVESAQVGQIHGQRQRQIVQIDAGVGALHVDEGVVLAGCDEPLVVPGDAAGHDLARRRTGGLTAQDAAGGHVGPGDAANAALAGHGAGKAAIFDGAPVLAGNAAGASGVALRRHRALGLEVTDNAARLHHAEQSGGGQTAGDADAPDGVALPVKHTPEGGNGQERPVRQRQVTVQHHRSAP